MADEIKPEEPVEEPEETEEEPEGANDDEQSWSRMEGMMRTIVKEELGSWSGPKKQTSSPSRKPPVKKTAQPQRRKGFLSGGFFQGLNPEE